MRSGSVRQREPDRSSITRPGSSASIVSVICPRPQLSAVRRLQAWAGVCLLRCGLPSLTLAGLHTQCICELPPLPPHPCNQGCDLAFPVPQSDSNRHCADFKNGRPASAGPRPPGWPTTLHRSDATPPGWKYPGRNRSGGLDHTDRLPRPHRSGHLRDRHLPRPRPARRGGHYPRRPKGPLAHRRDLAVGHRDLPSMAMTSGGLPLTTRPTGPYRPKETRPWKGRPPSDTGRPVTPTCNNQHPNGVSANPPPPTTAAGKIEARASCN